MKQYLLMIALSVIPAFMSCNFSEDEPDNTNTPQRLNMNLAEAFPKLAFEQPVELTSPDDGTDRIFVIAQKGKIHVFPNKADVPDAPVFLDITEPGS